jgi:RNA polymerase sigma-70 factor (ECF subfamily)
MQRSPDDIQDELLVLRCQSGEPAALDALVTRWQPRLWPLAVRLTGDRDAARDLAQDAWLAIVRGLRRLDDPAGFRAWAYRIVTNKCVDWLRRRAVRRDAAAELRGVANAEIDDHRPPVLDGADEVARMRAALRQLPSDQRTILSLHYLDGLSVLEIAAVLDVPAGTVKSRLHKARGQLRTTLQGNDHERA